MWTQGKSSIHNQVETQLNGKGSKSLGLLVPGDESKDLDWGSQIPIPSEMDSIQKKKRSTETFNMRNMSRGTDLKRHAEMREWHKEVY